MNKLIVLVGVCVLVAFGAVVPAAAAAESGAVSHRTTRLTVPEHDEVSAAVSACTTTPTGRRIACVDVSADGDGTAGGVLCVYDDALGVFGWGAGGDALCLATTSDWGYVGGAGACARVLGTDRPQACVNGRDGCLLWVMSVRMVCRTS